MRTPITAPIQPQPAQPVNNIMNQNVRQNNEAAAGGAQQNPFLNLLNQTGLGNQQAATASATNAALQAPQTGMMPPPFFFPSLPFMAPYTIPPPPMPQNIEQLTVEELRAMEGNERQHIEERLKLLRNVQTMLNASAMLMSQYQMVVANLPPIPVLQPSAAPSSSAAKVEETFKADQKVSLATEADKSQVKLEDLGSEEQQNVDTSNKPSTPSSQPSSSKATLDISSTETSTSAFLANESSTINGESEEANEIRKRRLQKFLQSD